MSLQTPPGRFVNTPTIGELYKAEHPETAVDLSEEDVEQLSEEYDKNNRTGTEAYYGLLFEHIREARKATPASVTGNEGFVSWVKGVVSNFIEMVKNFFKWIWGWFTGKKEAVDKKSNALADRLKKHGVRTGDITYPKGYIDLWGKPTLVPKSLQWMTAALDQVSAALEKSKAHKAEFKKLADQIRKVPLGGAVDKATAEVDKHITDYGKKVASLHGAKDGQWKAFVGIGLLNVSKDGKVSVSIDSKILPKAAKEPTFITNTNEVETLRKKIESIRKTWDEHNESNGDLEKVIIAEMRSYLDLSVSDDPKREKALRSLVGRVKKVASDLLVTIKAEENLFLNLISSGLGILEAAVNTSTTAEDK